jgi:hypothetical protein
MQKLHAMGFRDVLPVSSTYAGINLPDEGASDIDLNIGAEDVAAASEALDNAGVPFDEVFQNQRIHRYKTREGFDVEVKVRPAHEVAYQRPGWARMVSMPESEKAMIVADKHRIKATGDEAAYKAYKYKLYEKFGVIPPGGNWIHVKPPVKKASGGDGRDYAKEYREYHGKPEQIAHRAERNAARRELGLKKGDPREADHRVPLSRGGSNERANLRAVSRHENRTKADEVKEAMVRFGCALYGVVLPDEPGFRFSD